MTSDDPIKLGRSIPLMIGLVTNPTPSHYYSIFRRNIPLSSIGIRAYIISLLIYIVVNGFAITLMPRPYFEIIGGAENFQAYTITDLPIIVIQSCFGGLFAFFPQLVFVAIVHFIATILGADGRIDYTVFAFLAVLSIGLLVLSVTVLGIMLISQIGSSVYELLRIGLGIIWVIVVAYGSYIFTLSIKAVYEFDWMRAFFVGIGVPFLIFGSLIFCAVSNR